VPIETFEGMLEGIDDHGGLEVADLVLTGYFALADQVVIAAEAVRACPNAVVIVDPIMGDVETGLYVPEDVAKAVEAELVPMAHLLTPNVWEAQRLTRIEITDAATAAEAARKLAKPAIVSSVPCGDEIGVVYADPRGAWLAVHSRHEDAPRGAGDLLTALFAALLLEDIAPEDRLARAVGGVLRAVEAAIGLGVAELPLAGMGELLKKAAPTVRIEKLA
jgi:pyridoxine kinase